MKKIKNILLLFVMAVLLALPISASALEGDFTGVSSKCQTPDSEGYCTATVYLRLKLTTAQEEWTTVSGAITLKDERAASKIKGMEITSLDGASVASQGDITSSYNIIVKNDGIKLTTDKFTNAVKVTYKYHQSLAADEIDCGLKFTGKDITIETPKEENVKTGASLPYAILGVGAVGAVAIYLVTSKKSKIKNI